MALERACSGNHSDDSKQEATSGTLNRPQRWRFFLGNNNTTSSTYVHRQDENRCRIENQEEGETPPVIAGEEECNDDDQPLRPAASPHVCEYCGKEFSSGWALGAQKRIHGIKNKKSCPHHGSLNLDKTHKKSDNEHACNVCTMKFSSPGALYGHMRMHPERPKRGMKPTSEQPSPRHRPEKESRRGCDDLLNMLVAKGRVSGRDDWKDIVDDEEAMGAVLGLLMLSQGTSFRGSWNLNKDRKIESSKRMKKGNYSDDKGNAKTVDESECSDSDTDDDDEYVKVVGKCSKRKRHYLSNLSRDQKIEDPERMRIVKKRDYSDEKEKEKIVESKWSDSDADDDDYVIMEAMCLKRKRYCSRSRGFRIGQSYVDDRDRDTISPGDRNSLVPSPSTSWLEKYESSAAKEKTYECTTCNMRFSSKQGLGGHTASSRQKIKASATAKTSLIGNEDSHRSDNDSRSNNVDSISREDRDDTSFPGSCNLNKDQKIQNPQRTRIIKKGNYPDENGKAKIVKSKWSDSGTDEDEYVKVKAKYLSSGGLRVEQSCVDDRDRGTMTLQNRHGFIVPSPSTSPLKKYEWSTCDERFSAKQGLGSHMACSSHKIKASAEAKTPLIGNEDRCHGDNDGSNNNVDSREDHDATSLLTVLSCNNQDRSEISFETIGEESNSTRKNVSRFDLNELPSMEDDEEHL